jgi:hypothetical protein
MGTFTITTIQGANNQKVSFIAVYISVKKGFPFPNHPSVPGLMLSNVLMTLFNLSNKNNMP